MSDASRSEAVRPPSVEPAAALSESEDSEVTALGVFESGAAASTRLFALGYATTVFLSAFLLFQVQPLVSKAILPWFGGAPAVWTTCMLVFQALLFLGYLYAHLMKGFGAKTRTIVHLTILGLAILSLPILPGDAWKPESVDSPVTAIMAILVVCVGVPFFVLSTSGPLLQDWFRRTHPGRSPYRLYALSNAGSLLALLSYPFVIEPAFSLPVQSWIWSISFGLFVALCSTLGLAALRKQISAKPSLDAKSSEQSERKSLSFGRAALWFGLAAVPSAMLLATTNQVCLDVAAVPFLWVVPLSLYLLTFVICFDAPKRYSRTVGLAALVLSTLAMTAAFVGAQNASIGFQAFAFFFGLFACAYFCHGELARLKPEPARLTTYFLIIAAAGLAGGAFVSLLAPAIFTTFLEIHVAIASTLALALIVLFRRDAGTAGAAKPIFVPEGFEVRRPDLKRASTPNVDGTTWMWGLLLSADLMVVTFIGYQTAGLAHPESLDSQRNFFGVLRVRTKNADDPEEAMLEMMHGRIAHGSQFLDEKRAKTPTYYYAPKSGVGLALRHHRASEPRRIAVAGLGAGTLALYGTPGDFLRFYEINPAVVELAKERFTYLPTCQAEWDVVVADARLALEREVARDEKPYDVLVLDAFAGDSIPTHLLTTEAFAIYLERLAPDGILAVHISNRHFDLTPVLAAAAERYQLSTRAVETTSDSDGASAASWMLLSPTAGALDAPAFAGFPPIPSDRQVVWTDRRCDLFSVLRPIRWGDFLYSGASH
ncbi:MAG TPA: fused MFS/spermidine synthase [Pirellulaceae bacterium]|nr:fused MFS/spermidine synthase [Pirellulaceae bacterium]